MTNKQLHAEDAFIRWVFFPNVIHFIRQSPVQLRPSVRPIITTYHSDAGPIVRDHVGRTVGRSDRLRGNQYHIDQLADKHEAQRAELHQTDGRIAEIEAIHAEHAEKHGQQQSGVEMVPIAVRERELVLSEPRVGVQRDTHPNNLRPCARHIALEARIPRAGAHNSIGGQAPDFRMTLRRTAGRLLRQRIDVIASGIRTSVLAHAQLAGAVDRRLGAAGRRICGAAAAPR